MLKRNVINVKSKLNEDVKFLMVVKANAYGAGVENILSVTPLIDYFGVARAAEGAKLREVGVTKPIIVLSYSDSEVKMVKDYGLIPCVSNSASIKIIEASGIESVQLAIDTGMNRLGTKSICDFETLCNECGNLRVDGVYSHIYHNSKVCVDAQLYKFKQYIEIARRKFPNCICHIASSGTYARSECQFDMVRVGLDCYHDTMRISSHIIHIKNAEPWEDVGYNGEFVTATSMKIAIIEGGYADGIDKRLNRISVSINGMRARILGSISMDTFMVDVTGIDCEVGDDVSIIGAGDIDNITRCVGISEYELLVGLKGRYDYGIVDQEGMPINC